MLSKMIGKFQFLFIRILVPGLLNLFFGFFRAREKTLLIVKNDGIGDYILFRNYINELKRSAAFHQYKIYVLANAGFKEIALHLDASYVDGFYWYEDNYFLSVKLVKLLYQLQTLRLSTIVYPVLSRKYTTDWLISKIKAGQKIAVDGNSINISEADKLRSNKYYDKLIRLNHHKVHEFVINRQIIEALTCESCNLKQPFIEKDLLSIVPNDSVVIFLGANNPNKKWAADNFLALCNLLIGEFGVRVTLASDKTDRIVSEQIAAQLPGSNVTNKVGETTLVELVELIAGAKLIITGDTAALHIAAALKTPAICIARGDLYGRFIPYPANLHCPVISLFPAENKLNEKDYNSWSSFDINTVKISDVFEAARNMLALNLN